MTVGTLIGAGLLTWGSATLLLDAWLDRRHRKPLEDRLRPFSGSLADEAERWLNGRP